MVRVIYDWMGASSEWIGSSDRHFDSITASLEGLHAVRGIVSDPVYQFGDWIALEFPYHALLQNCPD